MLVRTPAIRTVPVPANRCVQIYVHLDAMTPGHVDAPPSVRRSADGTVRVLTPVYVTATVNLDATKMVLVSAPRVVWTTVGRTVPARKTIYAINFVSMDAMPKGNVFAFPSVPKTVFRTDRVHSKPAMIFVGLDVMRRGTVSVTQLVRRIVGRTVPAQLMSIVTSFVTTGATPKGNANACPSARTTVSRMAHVLTNSAMIFVFMAVIKKGSVSVHRNVQTAVGRTETVQKTICVTSSASMAAMKTANANAFPIVLMTVFPTVHVLIKSAPGFANMVAMYLRNASVRPLVRIPAFPTVHVRTSVIANGIVNMGVMHWGIVSVRPHVRMSA